MRTLLRLSLITAVAGLTLAPLALATDPAAPEIELVSPADGAVVYQGQQVQAAWGCLPGSLGWPIVACVGDVPLGAFLDTSSVGPHSFAVHAVDYAGAETTVIHSYTVFDVIPPVPTISAPAAGAEYPVGTQLYASYACDDGAGGSGVVGCIGSYPNGSPVPTGRPGTFTFTVDAFDVAGNHGSANVTYRVVDASAPQITITSPTDGATYRVGDPIAPAYSCHDDVDGTSVACKASPLDTSPGTHVFRVDSVDAAGNASFATATYFVHYPFDGFYSPLVAEPAVASFRAGDTVPVKFSLGGDRGLDVVARAAWRPCVVTTNDSSQAFGSLSYSAGPNRYAYMWKSDKSWAGSCREFLLVLRDGTTHAALISLR
jgi:hypothetical protein